MAEGTPIDIEYVARLARISLSPQEKETFRQQLGEILEYFERIAAVDIRGIELTVTPFPFIMSGARISPKRASMLHRPLATPPIVERTSSMCPKSWKTPERMLA